LNKQLKYLLLPFAVILILATYAYCHFILYNGGNGKILLELIVPESRKALLVKLKKCETLKIDDKERIELYCDVLEKKKSMNNKEYENYLALLSKQLIVIQKHIEQIELQHLGSPIGKEFKEDLFEREIPHTWIYSDGKNNAFVFTKINKSQYTENIWSSKNNEWCLINAKPGRKYPDNRCPFDARIELKCDVNKNGTLRNCYCDETMAKRLLLSIIK
jgi:hypothetical protein